MKVLICSPFIIDDENSNGTNKISFNLIKGLSQHSVTVLCPFYEQIKTSEELNVKTKYFKCNLVERNLLHRTKSLFSRYTFEEYRFIDLCKEMAKFVNSNYKEFNVIHVMSYAIIPLISMLNDEVKDRVVFSAIDSKILHEKSRLRVVKGWKVIPRYLQYCKVYFSCYLNYKSLRNIVFVSKVDALSMCSINKNSICIPNGVAKSKIKYQINNLRRTVVFHGDMTYEPNIRAAEALIGVLRENSVNKNTIKLIGKGSEAYDSKERNIKGMGFVDNLEVELSQNLCYVALIDTGAGIKNKVLDAFSVGLPVIATRDTMLGIPNATSGKEYILVNDLSDITNMIDQIENDELLRESLSVNGRRLVNDHYSWEAVTSSYIGLYKSVACNEEN
ncbi:glycosyltransferase [Vibrio harveyi]